MTETLVEILAALQDDFKLRQSDIETAIKGADKIVDYSALLFGIPNNDYPKISHLMEYCYVNYLHAVYESLKEESIQAKKEGYDEKELMYSIIDLEEDEAMKYAMGLYRQTMKVPITKEQTEALLSHRKHIS